MYDAIEFRNGYAADSRNLLIEWKGLELAEYEDSDGDDNNWDNFQFVILLGKVLKQYR